MVVWLNLRNWNASFLRSIPIQSIIYIIIIIVGGGIRCAINTLDAVYKNGC